MWDLAACQGLCHLGVMNCIDEAVPLVYGQGVKAATDDRVTVNLELLIRTIFPSVSSCRRVFKTNVNLLSGLVMEIIIRF